jgi:dihydropyrimidine dehydrogenase (NADP+)/dihydropyrimidine dehydrogenase (NAD+) subunit PreA
MEKHGFTTLADCKGRSLDHLTTHADLVQKQAARKAAQKAATTVKTDSDWSGDTFVQQTNSLSNS